MKNNPTLFYFVEMSNNGDIHKGGGFKQVLQKLAEVQQKRVD